jgi:hypothetical protein
MTPEEFRAILAQHGGLLGTEIVDQSKEEEIAGHKTGEMIPPPTIRIKYTTKDGTITARQHDDGTFEVLDDPKGLVGKATDPAASKAPETKTFPDGTERQWDPAKKDWVIIATKPQGPTQAESKPGAVPGLGNAPAERPGQLTNLDLVYAQANQFIAGVNADTNLNPTQRQAMIQAYLDGTVKPAADAATREANAYQQAQQQRQTQADARAQEAAARAGRTEERQSTTAERQAATAEGTLDLARQKASYDRGQDAVSNALKLLQYQVDPSFGPSLAGVYNRIMPGAFQPNAFTTQLPDIDAIAQAHVGPLLDMHASPVTGPSTQAGPAVPAGYPPAAPVQPPADPLAGVPITPRAPYPQPGGTGIVGRFGQ